MRIFIIQKPYDYHIYKVSDDLVEGFKQRYRGLIIIEEKNIQEAIIKFEKIEKDPGALFHSKLVKYLTEEQKTQKIKRLFSRN